MSKAKRVSNSATTIAPTVTEVISSTETTPVIDRLVNYQPSSFLDEQNVFNSKRYIKGAFEFKAPVEILQPVIAAMAIEGTSMVIVGSHSNTNGNTDNTINQAFGRMLVTVRRNIDTELSYEMGIMYALDLTVPKVKLFRGIKVNACLNQCVFGADDLQTININNGKELETLTSYVNGFNQHVDRVQLIVNRLKSTKLDEKQVRQAVGDMIIKVVTDKGQTGTTSIMRAIEMMWDSTSKYHIKQEGFSAWHLYNALTEYFDKKVNFWDIPEKAYSTFNLIETVAPLASQLELPLAN